VTDQQAYDLSVRRLIPASVAAFGLSLLFFAPLATAQTRGTTTSTISTGSGGHFVTATAPRAPQATNNFHPNPPKCCINPLSPLNANAPHRGNHPHRPLGGALYAVPYPVYYSQPYVDDSTTADAEPPPDDYAPGPTIFDRRGSNESSAAAEADYAGRTRQTAPEDDSVPPPDAAPEAAPVPEQPRTLLLFKDGHQMEVQNYAIVGDMLYDMTPGRRNKIAVADLDLTATAKANDDRGIDFQLPARPAAN
jgi:hypothetical protein